MSQVYSTAYKSVLRAVGDVVKDIQSTRTDLAIRYWAWEDRVDEEKLPAETLIGVNGFSFQENLGQWVVRFGITISTFDDANLLIEAELIDSLHDAFGEKMKISVFDPNTAEIINELASVHFEVMPMGQSQYRNYRTIGIEALRTGT